MPRWLAQLGRVAPWPAAMEIIATFRSIIIRKGLHNQLRTKIAITALRA
jgi:hypothetical protein